jgi:multiple sugar transport system substrate-binding protein
MEIRADASRTCRSGQRHERDCRSGEFGHGISRGAAIPAVLQAQGVYFDYWTTRGVDVRPFFSVLGGPRIPAPGGPGFPAGYQALAPFFDEMFLGRADVATTLGDAQAAANAAAQR